MAGKLKQRWRQFSRRVVPPRLMKHQIAWRNWRRGEPEIRLLKSLVPPGRTCVDVGAHLGAYTYFLERLSPEVHAFEPQADCARFLRKAYPAVTVHELALSDRTGEAQLVCAHEGGPAQAAHLAQPGQEGTGSTIRTASLDSLELADLGFAKIDAEGAELAIIQGGRDLLTRARPILLVEIEQRHISFPMQEVFSSLEQLGYAGEFLYAERLHALKEFSVDQMQTARLSGDRAKPYINNFIFKPLRH